MTKTKKEKAATQETKNAARKIVINPYVKKESVPMKETIRNVGINKKYIKAKNICRVSFRLPKIVALGSKSICIVGDFNNWNIHANPMKKLKNGDYSIVLDLETGREYQFRYLIDELKWENDWNADKYVRSHYGDSDNSVVVTY